MLARIMIILIQVYKRILSPLLPPACRFTPTCSEYAKISFERYGFFKGVWLTVRRLLRCHPFHQGGYDPVP